MIIFLHNPRCSKSRDALKLMKESKRNFTLIAYMNNPLDFHDLQDLQAKLKLSAIDFTRTNEKEFKESWLTKESSDEQILKAMAKHPKLMQRAIVYDDSKAVICRPPENIAEFFKK